MSKVTTGAFGAPSSAPASRVFDHTDRLVILTPVFAYQAHEAWRQCIDVVRTVPRARFRQPDGSVAVEPLVAQLITLPNDSHIDRARNVLSHCFLQTPYRFALWIDSDIEILPHHIERLWQHLMHGRKFVCGLYAMKCIVPTFVANVKQGATIDADSGLIELNDGGTGCMALDRSVFDTLRARFPERAYHFTPNQQFAQQEGFAYFRSGVEQRGDHGDWLSEDWAFCHDWKVCGGQVWGDTRINLHHWGPMRFPPDLSELVEALHRLTGPAAKNFPPALAAAAHPHLTALLDWCRAKKEAA